MFGIMRRKVDVPVAVEVVAGSEDTSLLEQHAQLSERLGVAPISQGELLRRSFKSALSEWGLRRYEGAQVRAFLTYQYGRKDWCFRPLREADRREHAQWWDEDLSRGAIQTGLRVYAKPIPMPVLLTIDRIVERFPSAKFYVSDERRPSDVSDPFLLILIDEEEYIIERWDEPNYRER